MDLHQERDAGRYRILRDYLLRSGIIHHVQLDRKETEPFVMGASFYGSTFEEAVDTLDSGDQIL